MRTKAAYLTGIEAYLTWCRSQGNDPKTAQEGHIEAFRAALVASGASRATIMLRLSAVRTLYKALCRAQVRPDNPAEYVKSPRPEAQPVDVVMRKIVFPEQMIAVLGKLEGDYRGRRDRALMLIFYLLGLRLSEAAGLDWEHWQGDTLKFVSKGQQERSLAVPEALKKALYDLKQASPGTGPMFLGEKGRLALRSIQKMIHTRLAAAGLADAGRGTRSPHAMRHSCGTVAAVSAASPYAIQDQLGHASQRTTSIYTRAAGRFLEAPSQVIAKALNL
jgi:site-specific recombinase XerC